MGLSLSPEKEMRMKARAATVLTTMLFALIVLAGCATTDDSIAQFDLNQDGTISDEEYQEAMKKENLLNSRQTRTSMRNRDANATARTSLYGVNTAVNVANSILYWTRWW
jgi:hypothetical protein